MKVLLEWFLVIAWSMIIWAGATLFFVYAGPYVLVATSSPRFFLIFVALEAVTALLIFLAVFFYIKIDRSKKAVLKCGIAGSAVGLFLDTFSLWNHSALFSRLAHDQMMSFTIWMSFAYSLFLLIPSLMYVLQQKRLKTPTIQQ
ncbi:DUF5367 family protein [Bacillus songklensis]|uniref:DUF5367 family protein n=1 Tax=Bacillus songklensis TaxID=1069116 RepID=A0ABV8B2B7_9BACI